MLDTILAAFADVFTWTNLAFIALGVTLGIVVGALPGLNSPMAIAIAVPMTFYMNPLTSLAFLMGVNKGGTFGGSITAVLLNTPGSPEAAATAFDGYPMARRGQAGKALKMALYASVFGDTFSDVVLILVAAPIAAFALMMGPPEITAVVFFALTFVASLTGESMMKGLAATALGIFISTFGLDIETATPRLTFGLLELQEGVPLIPMAIGMLALSEIVVQVEDRWRTRATRDRADAAVIPPGRPEDRTLTLGEFVSCGRTLVRSSVIGTAIGALPGIGSVVAGFLSYGAARRASPHPEEFGKGRLEGVAAAEAGNSAVVGANLIPLLALGIPGNLAAVMLVGAFLIQGIEPGPLLFQQQGPLIYGLFAAMLLANGFNLIIGRIGLTVFGYAARLPAAYVHPVIVVLCILGAYLAENALFGVAVMFIATVLAYLMRKLGFSHVTFLIGFVLGPMLELAFRQTVVLFGDHPAELLSRPVTLAVLLITVVFVWRRHARR